MIIFLLMNFFTVAASFLLTYRVFKFAPLETIGRQQRAMSLTGFGNFLDSLLAWFILYFAQIITTELVLGILGILYLKNVILLNVTILLVVWLVTHNKESSFSLTGIKDSLSELLTNRVTLLCACVILGFGLVKVFINLINPPFGWDSLNYHFTFPVEWFKNGNLDNPLVVSDDPFPTYYPINGSLFFLWLIFPFKSAFLADIGQLPFFIISFLSLFSICRKLRLDRGYSFFAACLFVLIPNFFKQLQIAYVDIMMGGIFLVALNFLFNLVEEYNFKNVFLFCLSHGIFLGIKTTAISYGAFLLVAFFYFIFLKKQVALRIKCRYSVVLFSLIFVFGCYSYFKNFLLTRNPFYPLNFSILGKVIFQGVIDKATFTARNIATDYSLAKLLFHEGTGIQTLLIILPSSIMAPIINIFINKNKNLFLNYIMFLPLLLYLTFKFILPIPNSRYLYSMLGTGMIVGFYMLHSIKIPLKIIRIIAIISIIVSAFECARRIELGISFVLSFSLFIIFVLLLKYKRLRAILLSKSIIISGILTSLIILQLSLSDYKKNEYIRYVKNSRFWPDATQAWFWLNNNTKANNIAYVGRPVPYPLYGTNFKNNVYYVSVNSLEPIHLHDLKDSKYRWDNAENMHKSFEEPNNYRGNAEYLVWLSNLYKRKTDYLFIYSLHHTRDIQFPLEDKWVKGHPEKFNLVFSNESIRIYKLNK